MADNDTINKLRGLSFFSGLDDEQLEAVSQYVEHLYLEPDAVVFNEGDSGDSVYFIEIGSLEVSMDSDWGESINLATLSDGSSFGEMSVIDDLPRSATVKATTESSVLSLKKADFEKILDEHPKIGVILLKGLARFLCTHLRESNESLSDFLEPT